MKFVDYVTITVRSGKGGAGRVSFRRDKITAKGGPDGGDGGNGGSIILEADDNLYTLLDLRYRRHHFARNGQAGGKANKTGKTGEDIILRVPPGTSVKNTDTDVFIGEVIASGDRLVLVQGGKGGRGNTHFKSPTNQTPQYAQPGLAGEEYDLTFELKLLADVGLVGFPNAGKSTLISALSAARPKIADYPFTTLTPQLGMVQLGDYRSFVMADIPGIIEGAHKGRGLGIQFLKHIERNAILLFVIPVTSPDPVAEYEILLHELEAFNATLLQKPRMVVLSKMDLLSPEERATLNKEAGLHFPEDLYVHTISSVAQMGLNELKEHLWQMIQAVR